VIIIKREEGASSEFRVTLNKNYPQSAECVRAGSDAQLTCTAVKSITV